MCFPVRVSYKYSDLNVMRIKEFCERGIYAFKDILGNFFHQSTGKNRPISSGHFNGF